MRSPDLAAAEILIGTGYSDSGDILSVVWKSIPTTDTSLSLTAPDPVAPTAPSDGGTIGVGSTLSWAGPDGALYTAGLQGDLT